MNKSTKGDDMKIKSILSFVLVSMFTLSTAYADKPVAISKADGPNSLEIGISVDVGSHKIMRNQNNKNTVNPAFAKTSIFCSMSLAIFWRIAPRSLIDVKDHLVKAFSADIKASSTSSSFEFGSFP